MWRVYGGAIMPNREPLYLQASRMKATTGIEPV